MRHLIIILLFLFSNIGYSQIESNILIGENEQSTYLLGIINDYREQSGLNRLVLDTNLSNACESHSIYMSFYNCAGHSQNRIDSIHLMKNISFFRDRAISHGGKVGNWIAENSTNISMLSPETLPWGNKIKNDTLTYKEYSYNVLSAWIYSSEHNKTLLNKKGITAGVYQYVYYDSNNKLRVASTFLITNYVKLYSN